MDACAGALRRRRATARSVSDRGFAALARTDADRFFDRQHENLAVTDAAGHRRLLDRLDHLPDLTVRDHDLDLHLRHEVDHVRRAAVDLFLTAGAAEAFDLADGHALNSELAEIVFYVVQLERLDDGFDFFHESSAADCVLVGRVRAAGPLNGLSACARVSNVRARCFSQISNPKKVAIGNAMSETIERIP